eukprot:3218211-Pleurochrysis_carterae.AAC.3
MNKEANVDEERGRGRAGERAARSGSEKVKGGEDGRQRDRGSSSGRYSIVLPGVPSGSLDRKISTPSQNKTAAPKSELPSANSNPVRARDSRARAAALRPCLRPPPTPIRPPRDQRARSVICPSRSPRARPPCAPRVPETKIRQVECGRCECFTCGRGRRGARWLREIS